STLTILTNRQDTEIPRASSTRLGLRQSTQCDRLVARLTNVRDFPVPKRHRGVRIELRNRSFRKGKSHERSFHAWNRLGKECFLGARVCGGRGSNGRENNLPRQARGAGGAAAAVPDRPGGLLGSARLGTPICCRRPYGETDGTEVRSALPQER